MWCHSKLAKSMAAARRRDRMLLPILGNADVPAGPHPPPDPPTTLCFLAQTFPGIQRAILEEIDAQYEGDVPDDIVEMLLDAVASIDMAYLRAHLDAVALSL
jgi:hypothetical protein